MITRQAIDLRTQALAVARDIGDRTGEGNALGDLGLCHYSLVITGRRSTCIPRP